HRSGLSWHALLGLPVVNGRIWHMCDNCSSATGGPPCHQLCEAARAALVSTLFCFPALMARRPLWGVGIALFLASFLTTIRGCHPVKSYSCCVMTSQYRASTIYLLYLST